MTKRKILLDMMASWRRLRDAKKAFAAACLAKDEEAMDRAKEELDAAWKEYQKYQPEERRQTYG